MLNYAPRRKTLIINWSVYVFFVRFCCCKWFLMVTRVLRAGSNRKLRFLMNFITTNMVFPPVVCMWININSTAYTIQIIFIFIFYFKDYKEIVKTLPESDKPSFFGLPANIDRSAQRIVSSQVMELNLYVACTALASSMCYIYFVHLKFLFVSIIQEITCYSARGILAYFSKIIHSLPRDFFLNFICKLLYERCYVFVYACMYASITCMILCIVITHKSKSFHRAICCT